MFLSNHKSLWLETNITLGMKLFLILSLLALCDAWFWNRRHLPFKRGNLAGKGLEQGSPAGPLKAIVGEIDDLRHDIATLTGRVDELESNFEELVSAIEEQENGYESLEPTAEPSSPGTSDQGSVPSDETAVRALLQRLESRLKEKQSEQKKQVN
ncbi:hypothetical protein CHS0354_027704 [Potamilus streckersoni]|uniref:Uncharacterized protein n=1 Tax=Potamilus streckersoni TaxID=2493646 RepID=A0AAE0RMN9_9BIVA|nr:hypothetical protein CHS0354_027704 [Potamilus streckersoni]